MKKKITVPRPPRRICPVGQLSRSERIAYQEKSPLVFALDRLGITPYKTTSINQYKEDRQKQFDASVPTHRTIRRSIMSLFVTGGVGLVICISQFLSSLHITTTLAFATCFSIFLMLVGTRGREHKIEIPLNRRDKAKWQWLEYKAYKVCLPGPPVPILVQRIAAKIEEIPYTECYVHYFHTDPILEVIYMPPRGRSESRFVAIWDEKGVVE